MFCDSYICPTAGLNKVPCISKPLYLTIFEIVSVNGEKLFRGKRELKVSFTELTSFEKWNSLPITTKIAHSLINARAQEFDEQGQSGSDIWEDLKRVWTCIKLFKYGVGWSSIAISEVNTNIVDRDSAKTRNLFVVTADGGRSIKFSGTAKYVYTLCSWGKALF